MIAEETIIVAAGATPILIVMAFVAWAWRR